MDSKPFYRSTTFWLNALFVLGTAAEWIIGNPGLLEGLGVSPTAQAAILAVANVLLRFRTKRPVSLTAHG